VPNNAQANPPLPKDRITALVRQFTHEGDANILRRLKVAGIDPLTDLRGVDLSHTNLHGLDLSGIDLSRCSLRWSDLGNAKLIGAKLIQAAPVQGRLENSNLSHADLRGANLQQCSLRIANLSHADLRGANLSETILFGADIEGAHWDEPLARLAPFLHQPERLLGDWDDAEQDDEEAALGPLSLRLLFDGLAMTVMTAIIFCDSGLNPVFLDMERCPQLLATFLLRDIETIGEVLGGERKDLLLERRRQSRKGSGDNLAELDRRIGMLTLLTRNYDQAEEHLKAAQNHFYHRRKQANVAEMHAILGLLAFDKLQPVTAVKQLRQAMTLYDEMGAASQAAHCGLALAAMALLHGRMDRVQQFVTKAAQVLESESDERFTARQTIVAGLMAWKNGDSATAYKLWDGARHLLSRAGDEIDAMICQKLCEAIGRLTG